MDVRPYIRVVEKKVFFSSVLPPLDNAIDFKAVFAKIEGDEKIIKNGRIADFPQDPHDMKPKEDVAYLKLQTFVRKVDKVAKPAGRQSTFVFYHRGTVQPKATSRKDRSRPDSYALVRSSIGKLKPPVWWKQVVLASEVKKHLRHRYDVSNSYFYHYYGVLMTSALRMTWNWYGIRKSLWLRMPLEDISSRSRSRTISCGCGTPAASIFWYQNHSIGSQSVCLLSFSHRTDI